MLQVLARYHRSIAWFFVGVIYMQLVLIPAVGYARMTKPLTRPVYPTYFVNTPVKKVEKPAAPEAPKKQPAAPTHIKTTGPGQPEMSTFQSVNANNMVDLFTGDFSYNIPLLDVGGYPVNLHYQSGVTMDQEASWVGLGWNINPGVISRNMRGLPDDAMGDADEVKKTVSVRPNKTFGITLGANAEMIGITVPKLDASLGVFHNTYKGWGTEFGLNASINAGSRAKGPLTGSLGITNNSQNGLSVSPSLSLKLGKEDAKNNGFVTVGSSYNSRFGVQSLEIDGGIRSSGDKWKNLVYGSLPGSVSISFARPAYTPTITMPYTSNQFSFTAKLGGAIWGFHPNGYVRGYGSNQKIDDDDKVKRMPAYGYLYYDKAGSNHNVLLDFNREKEVSYTPNSPHIAIPVYTYDTYSITGEGTGGMFRPYRNDIGFVFDHAMQTKSISNAFSVDLGFGNVAHVGSDINTVYAVTKNNPWINGNALVEMIKFRAQDTTWENVYFKNPGEKTSVDKNWLRAVGNDSLMRIDLSPLNAQNVEGITASANASLFKGGRAVATRQFNNNSIHKFRDKRTQAISWLNAKDASHVGLDKVIRAYEINSFPSSCTGDYKEVVRYDDGTRQEHHLSEITVLNADGRRYVYGVPAYNLNKSEVTMSVEGMEDKKTGLTGFEKTGEHQDNTTGNNKGRDHYFSKEEMKPYAHSFLLSGILSDDYVDLTGDGITTDDPGDAVKFNYSRPYSTNTRFGWRAPLDSANYNEGLKSDGKDDKGSYIYGQKEVWYLNSIESKTMIATFVVEQRLDACGASNEDGGIDTEKKLYRLKQINLYSKPDFVRNGPIKAVPIKTVHFGYTYTLCTKNPGSVDGVGKLTLDSIYFTYNNNSKGKKNPYKFKYHDNNPAFTNQSVDRWGNYKNPANNPGLAGQKLTNADYPFTLQPGVHNWDTAKATYNAAPWTLSKITLPSGGRIEVSYESDDYAYVQNKRAQQFFSIAGFGNSENGPVSNRLYPFRTANSDYHYVFVDVPEPVNSLAEVARKYLDGVTQLYFKLAVNVPADTWGDGYEIIPVYAQIARYGLTSNNKRIWIEVRSISRNESPFATTALQFLRLNLPGKAYPYSEPGDNVTIRDVAGMLASVAANVVNAVDGFGDASRKQDVCESVRLDKSFIRLNNPIYRKYGGGHRVKRVEVYDNWKDMTGQTESKYGQTYDYTTLQHIDGVPTRISSGVATYEPAIGNDENPFKVPQKLYSVQAAALAPEDFVYTEDPLGETFFPAPMIGYSKVRVQTIHHRQKSANGFDESEFYTAKDFPVIVEMTPLDLASRKPFNPKVANALKFDARNYITLSQGFKIELNDMNGKMKSQASYAQNDTANPISYTYNYYRLKNDIASQPVLSNKVTTVDSANGVIDTTSEVGVEVELMVDVREQFSETISGSLELNVDNANIFPPIVLPSAIPLPSFERTRYRAVAVTKVVNRYAILDSIIHLEKGSKVTTRNLLYDGETGDVLVSQTNNEFDDPVYNLNYPAHWAYSGMGAAYKNLDALYKGILFKQGKMHYDNGPQTPFPAEQKFESGDEVLVYTQLRNSTSTDTCNIEAFYKFGGNEKAVKLWAVDMQKGITNGKGILFIDASGIPFTGRASTVRIIRSGKRNFLSTPVGSITSLRSPIKTVAGKLRLVTDSTIGVIAASAARFKDFWRTDSTTYQKDTTMILARRATLDSLDFYVNKSFMLEKLNKRGNHSYRTVTGNYVEMSTFDQGGNSGWDSEIKSWLQFDFGKLQPGIQVQEAKLYLYNSTGTPHTNLRGAGSSNSVLLERVQHEWIEDAIVRGGPTQWGRNMQRYFDENRDNQDNEPFTSTTIPATPLNQNSYAPGIATVTGMAANMINAYYASGGSKKPIMRLQLANNTGDRNSKLNKMIYNSGLRDGEPCSNTDATVSAARANVSVKVSPHPVPQPPACDGPVLRIKFYKPCIDGSKPISSNLPTPGYYCYSERVDTFVCRPNIVDSAINPYRWTIYGKWRVDRAYTYYDRRKQSNPLDSTNIRTDGEIKSFTPYWSFNNTSLINTADTNKWVWNSEITALNIKGMELENHDPLNRYNAGQYGYAKTLPVAVTQNSRYRNQFFEGFEDYNYSTDTCKKCPVPRFIDMVKTGTRISTESHTGMYSLMVAGNTSNDVDIPIVPIAKDTISPSITFRIDSTALVSTAINPKGKGLKMEWRQMVKPSVFIRPRRCQNITIKQWYPIANISNVDTNMGAGKYPEMCHNEYYEIQWTGFIQPRYTDTYIFSMDVDDMVTAITVNGQDIATSAMKNPHYMPSTIDCVPIPLEAGKLYPITVGIRNNGGQAWYHLRWRGISRAPHEMVPKDVLYLPNMQLSDSAGSVKRDTNWCVKYRAPKPKAVTLPAFSPVQGQKVVVSTWLKEQQTSWNGLYEYSRASVLFDNGALGTVELLPAGLIVEGWQRREAVVPIPPNATMMKIRLQAPQGFHVYFDDVRVHPFNANMKSFVYNPVNLRLMAELDENNNATFYEYDDEGTLIRVKKETDRGIKTIKETRSALQKKNEQ